MKKQPQRVVLAGGRAADARCAGRRSRRAGATGAGGSGKNVGPHQDLAGRCRRHVGPVVDEGGLQRGGERPRDLDHAVAPVRPRCRRSPSHLSPTAMPPVKATLPSITIARRWLRLWKRVSLPRRGAAEELDLRPRGRSASIVLVGARGPAEPVEQDRAPARPPARARCRAATTSSLARPFSQM